MRFRELLSIPRNLARVWLRDRRRRRRPALEPRIPIILISSCKSARQGGDARYNGGLKLYSLWVKLLRAHGYPAWVVTWDGTYQDWLVEHQPHISLATARRWSEAGLPLVFVTGWADATAFVRLAPGLHFYDCEMTYTAGRHRHLLDELMDDKIDSVVTHSRTQQAWYMSTYGVTPTLLPIWCDEDHWRAVPERRERGLIGFMEESPDSHEEMKAILRACAAAGLEARSLQVKGDEARVIEQMQRCDLFVGLNHGKHPLWGEGSPIPPLEAMHAGCVVVAYDVHGNREYLLDGSNGFIVPRGDTVALVRRVVQLLQDDELRESMRRRSLDLVARCFSSESRWPILRDFLGLVDLPDADAGPAPQLAGLTQAGLGELLGDEVYMGEEEIGVFARYASQAHGRLLEIGAGYGTSAFLMLASAPPRAEVVSVDPFVSDSMSGFRVRPAWCRENVQRALAALGRTRRLARWSLLLEPSYELVRTWQREIDFLFIDGDHRYEAVRRDYDDWVGFVPSGGVVLIHDSRREEGAPEGTFARGWPGPTRLAAELRSDPAVELVEEAFSLTVWRRTDRPAGRRKA